MGFQIPVRQLASLAIRQDVTGGNLTRSMDLSSIVGGLASPDTNEDGQASQGFWGNLWEKGKNLLKKAGKLIADIVGFSFRKIVDWILRGVGFLWRFNWNIQSSQVDLIQQQAIINIAGAIGGAAGMLAGAVVGGVIPGLILTKFNKALGLHALQELKDEVLDDIVNELANALTATAANLGRVAALRTYIGLRNAAGAAWVSGLKALSKKGLIDPAAVEVAEQMTQTTDEVISIQQKFQEGVSTLPEWGQEFVEEFVEEFSDTTKDCLLIVAGAVDSFYAQSATMDDSEALQAVVEIDFNRDTIENPDPNANRE